MAIERWKITSREEWLERRKADVTASVVGALFNCHPYTTALKLYVQKRGVEFPVEDNNAMRRGRWMESAVGAAVAETRPEWQIVPAGEYLRDPELRLGATPDFYIHGDPRGLGNLQTKTLAPGVFERDGWDQGEVPLWITLQTTIEGLLCGASFSVIAALVVDAANMQLVIHEVPRIPAAEAKIRDVVIQFWRDVENGREPDPDFARDADTIKAMWKRERKPPNEIDLSGDNHIPDLLAERCTLKESEKLLKTRIEAIDAEVKYAMKDAAIGTGVPGFKISFKTTAVKEYVVAAREQRILRVIDQREKA